VSHNISNSETEGYSRQRVRSGSQPAEYGDPRRGGRGARIESISRASDRFVNEQVRRDRTLLGFFTSRERALYALESVYSEDIAPSINSGFDSFFNSLRDLTRDPANRGARSNFLGGAQEIVDVFRTVHEDLRKLQIDIDLDITGRVDEVNHLTSYIAQLNSQVVASGKSSMDYEDKRDEAVRRLSELVDITILPQDSGSVNIQLSGVGTLVQDHLAANIEAIPDPSNRRSVTLEFTGVGGSNRRDVTSQIDRGELGGLLNLRDQTIGTLLDDVNGLALQFANSVNAQHEAGFDLNGDRGQALFTFDDTNGDPAANISVNIDIAADTDLIAISANALRDPVDGSVEGGVPGDALNGIAITELQYMTMSVLASATAGSTYTGNITVGGAYNGGFGEQEATLTVLDDTTPNDPRFRLDIANIVPPPPGGADNGGAGYTINEINAILAPSNVSLNFDQNGSQFTNGDTVEINLFKRDSTFNRTVAETLQYVGQTAATNYQQTDIYATRLDQSSKLQESVSGVSIDEELLDLTRFEKQFAANGRVIQTVNELMDSVLSLIG
jgi:flagellar hook-associated protein 1 FlgK